jgi:DNA-binding XRE family transcriptional regulator
MKKKLTPAEVLANAKPRRDPEKDKAKKYQRRYGIYACDLRKRRTELHLTLDEVANAVGISTASMSNIEYGGNVSVGMAMNLADFYGTTVYEIWKRT